MRVFETTFLITSLAIVKSFSVEMEANFPSREEHLDFAAASPVNPSTYWKQTPRVVEIQLLVDTETRLT